MDQTKKGYDQIPQDQEYDLCLSGNKVQIVPYFYQNAK